MTALPPDTTLVRCASHRAREKLFRLTGPLHGWFSWQAKGGKGFYPVPNELLAEALAITGISRASTTHTYQPCW